MLMESGLINSSFTMKGKQKEKKKRRAGKEYQNNLSSGGQIKEDGSQIDIRPDKRLEGASYVKKILFMKW